MDYIVLSSMIRMDTRASLYRRERGALASNLTNVGQAPRSIKVLRNSPTLPVDKTLGMFIKNEQPSLVRPIL